MKEVDVKPTNLSHSQAIAYLHLNTDDNHLHFLVNRIDEDGNLNDDTVLLNRAFMAAQIINQRRGWQDTLDRSKDIQKEIRSTMFDVLKRLPEFSWDAYKDVLQKEGLLLKTKVVDGKVVNYKVHYEGRKSEYNASDIDRSLTAAHIEDTYDKISKEWTREKIRLYMEEYLRQHPDVEVVEPDNIKHDDRSIFALEPPKQYAISDDKRNDGNSIHHHFKFGFYECSFDIKRIIESLLRSEIKQAITEEKRDADTDYLELLNKTFDLDSIFKVAAMLFVGYVDAATSMSESIGGGGSSCTSGWGKKDDDEEEWARKCARQAVKMCKPQMVKQAATKSKGWGR